MKKLYLEFIRGAAAVIVLIYHFLELHSLSTHSKHFYFANWGTDAVMIFFILSGVVINISQTNNPKSERGFITNRLIRLYPQLVVGLIIGLVVLYITQSVLPSAWVIAGNFLMISAVKGYMINIVPCIETNSPIWSLSYEILFYMLFALCIGRFQKKTIIGWFILSIILMPFYYAQTGSAVSKHIVAVITFSSIWLVGYYIYEYRHYFYVDKYAAMLSVGTLPLISRMHISTLYYDPAKYLLFAVFAIPFFRYCLQVPKQGKQIKWYYLAIPFLPIVYIVFNQPYLTFSSFVFYSALPVVLMLMVFAISILHLKEQTVSFVKNTGGFLGKYSYSIYIIHYPILFLGAALFHNTLVNLVVSVSTVAILAYSLETYLQPVITRFFKNIKLTQVRLFIQNLQGRLPIPTSKKIIVPALAGLVWLLSILFHK